MTSQPTANDVEAASAVLAKAALLDPRISAGDEGTILAWAEVLSPAKLDVDDLLSALVKHYSSSSDRIMPAELLRLARARRQDRLARTVGSDTAPPQAQLPPATIEARKQAIAQAAAQIGQKHDVDTRATFAAAPARRKPVSQATIAAKVARVRAAAPPAPMA